MGLFKKRKNKEEKNKQEHIQENKSSVDILAGILQEDEEVEEQNSNFFEKIAEKDLYKMLIDMGNSKQAINKYMRDRIIQSLSIFIILAIISLIFEKWLIIVAMALTILIYRKKYTKVKAMYNVWLFERHLQFAKFTRLLIPYLKQSQGSVSLYTIFNKILMRTENEADRKSLYKLMTEMTINPTSEKPFIEFAERSSGTDMSILFMSTVYDYQQSTNDMSVIDELGKISSEELLNGIDEIIEFKSRRFNYFPTKVVMTSFIIVIGYAAAVLWHNIQQLQF